MATASGAHAHHEPRPISSGEKKVIFASSLGTVFEWYDFYLYGSLAAIIGAQVERKVRQYMPDDLDMILTSVITLLIMGAVTFLIIMPIGGELFKGMSWLFQIGRAHV